MLPPKEECIQRTNQYVYARSQTSNINALNGRSEVTSTTEDALLKQTINMIIEY